MFVARSTVGLMLCLHILCVQEAVCQDEVPPLELKFVDAYGKAVEGAKVHQGTLVFEKNTGLSIATGKLKDNLGGEAISKADGSLVVPIRDFGLGNLLRFRLHATHEEFADFEDWIQVNPLEPNEITLSRGMRIAMTAVDAATEQPIQDNIYAIAEQKDVEEPVDWKSNGRGMLVSNLLKTSDRRVRFVQIVNGNAVRFSEPIDVKQKEGQRAFLNKVPMYASLEIRGRLSDDVQRPVVDGLVVVCVAWPDADEAAEYGPAGHWLAHVKVAADGTFLLSGVPSGAWLQVIASCDGWFNQAADVEMRRKAYDRENKLLNIDESILPWIVTMDEVRDIVVPMQKTSSTTIGAIDSEGEPIQGVKVVCNRSQRFFHASWGSREFGVEYSTCKQLIAARRNDAKRPYAPRSTMSFEAKTNQEGLAMFSGLPGNQILARVDGHSFANNRFWKPIVVENAKVHRLQVEPRPLKN